MTLFSTRSISTSHNLLLNVIDIIITVTGTPTFQTPPGDTQVTVMGSTRINCEGVGEPEVTYRWFFTNSSGELL